MDNGIGNVGPYDVGTLALLGGISGCGGVVGGRGGLCYGNDVLAANAHADGTAVKEAVDCNAKMCSAGLDRISDQAEESRRSAQFTSIRDGQFQAELRNSDRLQGIQQQLNDMALANCKCCEEAKLLACQNKSEILAAIESNAKDVITRELNAANARVTQLTTIDEITRRCGCCPS